MKTFDMKRLGGLFGQKDEDSLSQRMDEAMTQANHGQRLHVLISRPEWQEFQAILRDIYNINVRDMSSRELRDEELKRINHRFELLKDIETELARRIEAGAQAAQLYEKLKGQMNVRTERQRNNASVAG